MAPQSTTAVASTFVACIVLLLSWQQAALGRHCTSHLYKIKLHPEGCKPYEMYTRTCAGLCGSSSEPNTAGEEEAVLEKPFIDSCKCCMPKEGKVSVATVFLNCTGGTQKEMKVPKATECICRACGALHTSGASQNSHVRGPDNIFEDPTPSDYGSMTINNDGL